MQQIATLHVGTDSALLSTRTLVLRQAGFSVVSVSELPDAIRQFLAGDFDVVILCHSVPVEDRKVIANLVHSHSSSIPVVLVGKNNESDFTMDAVLNTNPATLVKRLPEILSANPNRHADSTS